MTICHHIISGLWLVLIAYWAISAFGAKRSVRTRKWSREIGVRLGVLILILAALHNSALRNVLRNAQAYLAGNPLIGIIGVVLCALGICLAIWARAYLGRNWGIPMSRKENPELVTTGPYAFVRHPIYSGILIAMLGTTIGGSVFWVLPLILAGAYFVYSARREEKLMIEQFPEQYPGYMKRTKMLLPFLL